MARYTPEQKAAALDAYMADGVRAASKSTGIPHTTIARWAKQANLASEANDRTKAATETVVARAHERRARIREKLLERAEALLDRIEHPHLELKVLSGGRDEGAHVEHVEIPLPTAAAVRDYAVSVGILIDKYRLEMGEDTDRRRVTQDLRLAGLSDEDLDRELRLLLAGGS